jgi:hypothetical protein
MKTAAMAILTVVALAILCVPAMTDPLPGEILKFQQLPLDSTVVQGTTYNGHDEISSACANVDTFGNIIDYQGSYMADDFADKVSTSVVHVKWWGSYLVPGVPSTPVQQFLISFETDVPAAGGVASHPGTPLLSQIVSSGMLTPGSGTFTETLVNGNVPEHLYKYNAELALPFAEQKDTVYWLKIVALTNNSAEPWGWHDRDYTSKDFYASSAFTPGESDIGPSGLLGTQQVWHFQDDAVSGGLTVTPNPGGAPPTVVQTGFAAQSYIDVTDGPQGIGSYSKDLAFELYTVPEPATMSLLALGGLTLIRRRK